MSVKALVIDDAVVFRRIVSETLAALPGVEVVGSAATGKMALAKIAELSPDFVTLDIEMPDMDGLAVLTEMRRRGLSTGVIVVSALTEKGGDLTLRALELGAFDFVTKPSAGSFEENARAVREDLAPIVKALSQKREIQSILRGQASTSKTTSKTDNPPPPAYTPIFKKRPEMVVIGVSTGGPVALAEVIPMLPADLNVPVLIVQHMPPVFTHSLAVSLAAKSRIRVCEARDEMRLEPNVAYIAPGGKQMKVVPGAGGARIIRITDDPPECNCRPAVDYLFRSVANHFPGTAMAVIMTGMGSDGTLGLRLLKRSGCFSVAQDAASCVVFGMPGEAVKAGVIDIVVPLQQIASEIRRQVKGAA